MQPEPAKPADDAEQKPAGIFAGLSESKVQKLWAQAQTLAALDLARQAEAAEE